MYAIERVRSKRAFFVFRPSSQHQKGLSDTSKLLIPLTCKILFKLFLLLFNIMFYFYAVLSHN